MEQLSYRLLREQGYEGFLLEKAPERVLQFGEGNFLRAFVDYFIDVMNEKAGFGGKVAVVQPVPPLGFDPGEALNRQEGLYTLYLRGFEGGAAVSHKRVVSCISRCLNPYKDNEAVLVCAENPSLRFITCNTTEAGIRYDPACRLEDSPPSSFPAKLAQLLYRRYQLFGQEAGKGFIVLACELIDNNGRELQGCVERYAEQWQLGAGFRRWLKEENLFCSTLVDRIVTGYPQKEAQQLQAENGYVDQIMDTGEAFGFWVIEGPESLKAELPFERAGLPILLTDDHMPYKQRKVRILNGAHTAMVLGAYLCGQEIVRDCLREPAIGGFLNRALYEEIIPTLTLPRQELEAFALAVTERFQNPFIDHKLLSISLNSVSKWRARVLPSLLAYQREKGQLPPCLTASFAFMLAFYRGMKWEGGALLGLRDGEPYPIQDDQEVLKLFFAHKNDSPASLTRAVMQKESWWGQDLTLVPGFEQAVAQELAEIEGLGAYQVMARLAGK